MNPQSVAWHYHSQVRKQQQSPRSALVHLVLSTTKLVAPLGMAATNVCSWLWLIFLFHWDIFVGHTGRQFAIVDRRYILIIVCLCPCFSICLHVLFMPLSHLVGLVQAEHVCSPTHFQTHCRYQEDHWQIHTNTWQLRWDEMDQSYIKTDFENETTNVRFIQQLKIRIGS